MLRRQPRCGDAAWCSLFKLWIAGAPATLFPLPGVGVAENGGRLLYHSEEGSPQGDRGRKRCAWLRHMERRTPLNLTARFSPSCLCIPDFARRWLYLPLSVRPLLLVREGPGVVGVLDVCGRCCRSCSVLVVAYRRCSVLVTREVGSGLPQELQCVQVGGRVREVQCVGGDVWVATGRSEKCVVAGRSAVVSVSVSAFTSCRSHGASTSKLKLNRCIVICHTVSTRGTAVSYCHQAGDTDSRGNTHSHD